MPKDSTGSIVTGAGAYVSRCGISECAYHLDGRCSAIAITISSGAHPRCGTFLKAPSRPGGKSGDAHVGECRYSNCRHNSNAKCGSSGIEVDYCWGHVDCMTYVSGRSS